MLGDTIAKIASKTGVKSCIPCKARQQKLNDFHQNILNTITKVKERFSTGSQS